MTDETKDKIIHDEYYDESGFGSINRTYQEAKRKDKTITLNYVKNWFERNMEKTKQPSGQNSFIAPHPYYEFQLDLFFLEDLKNQQFKVGMCCVDIFTKYAVVVAIKSKKEGDVAAGLIECIHKMGKKPEILYTDDEGSLNSNSIQKYLQEKVIKHHVTRSHAFFAERFIRTFKNMLYTRLKHNKDNQQQWHEYIFQIMLTYNNKNVHSATGKTPNDATKTSNQIIVKLQMELHARRNRKYPPIIEGDQVKILRKKTLGEKEHISNFSEKVYKINSISEKFGQNYHKLEGENREYLRNELLKV